MNGFTCIQRKRDREGRTNKTPILKLNGVLLRLSLSLMGYLEELIF